MNRIAPEYHRNPSQRTPCLLVLDASGSMGTKLAGRPGTRMDELNEGLKTLRSCLLADESACARVQLALVCVGGTAGEAELIVDWVDATDFEPPVLRAGGQTPLARGMRLALHHVEQQKVELRRNGISYTRPWVMVMSDGEPTDPSSVWDSVVAECRFAEQNKRCVIFPIGVADADVGMLQQLSATPVARLTQVRFREYFQWLSASLSSVSRSRPGDSVALPATDPWAMIRT